MAVPASQWGELTTDPGRPPDSDVSAFVGVRRVSVQLLRACKPEGLRDLITDVVRIGEFGPECA